MDTTLAALYPDHIRTVESRHDRVLTETGFDHAVIFGGSERTVFLDDYPYPFKVNPHFKAWVPVLTNPNCFVSYTPGKKPVLIYFRPVDYWHKPAGEPEGYWVEHFDIRMIGSLDEARQHLPTGGRTVLIGEPDGVVEDWGFAAVNPSEVVDRIHFARAWKTDYEIECMRQANAAGVRGHLAAERAFRAGASEYEIHLQYLRATAHNEAQLPYSNIIAINENAAVLHYQHQEREVVPADKRYSFLIDAGASVNGYASDITRTYSEHDDEFRALIGAMDEKQQELCAEVRPGLDYRELHLSAHRKVAEMLVQFGFVNVDAGEAVQSGMTRTFLPHGVGHLIGLQVHDVGGFMKEESGETIPRPDGHPFLRLTRKVDVGQSFTIEPGFYFIDSL
ncbi:MAG: Xaa-Pro dipeptidase, partial [Acidobacteriota bacterium]